MQSSYRIAGIVLAAGSSKRAGAKNKLLLDISGRPMVARVVETALAAGLDPVFGVTGHQASEVGKIIKKAGGETVHNPDHEKGMGASIAAGIAALASGVDGAVICLGDMAEVRRQTIQALVRGFATDGGQGISVPVMDGRRGNPVLFGAAFFPALKELHDDKGGKGLIAAHAGSVKEVTVEDPGIFIDRDSAVS